MIKVIVKMGNEVGRVVDLSVALKTIRELQGTEQQKVAEKIDIFAGALSRIETGKRIPSLSTLVDLVDLYGYRLKIVKNK